SRPAARLVSRTDRQLRRRRADDRPSDPVDQSVRLRSHPTAQRVAIGDRNPADARGPPPALILPRRLVGSLALSPAHTMACEHRAHGFHKLVLGHLLLRLGLLLEIF